MADATLKELSDALLGAFELAMAQQSGSFRERETAALRLANEVVRRWTELELRRIAARYEDEVFVDGQRYRRHASGARRYHSLCGSVEVQRNTYRLIGIHNGPTVVPLEIEAGIVENATPALAWDAPERDQRLAVCVPETWLLYPGWMRGADRIGLAEVPGARRAP